MRIVALLSMNESSQLPPLRRTDSGRLATTNVMHKIMFMAFTAIAACERDLVTERTEAGLASARASGQKNGRPFAN